MVWHVSRHGFAIQQQKFKNGHVTPGLQLLFPQQTHFRLPFTKQQNVFFDSCESVKVPHQRELDLGSRIQHQKSPHFKEAEK